MRETYTYFLIPNFNKYLLTNDLKVKLLGGNKWVKPVIRDNVKGYILRDNDGDVSFIPLDDCIDIVRGIRIIKRGSGEGRQRLDRDRVIQMLLRYFSWVRIPLTKGKDGQFGITHEMELIGMAVCPECGHIQNCEERNCKECNEFITPPAGNGR